MNRIPKRTCLVEKPAEVAALRRDPPGLLLDARRQLEGFRPNRYETWGQRSLARVISGLWPQPERRQTCHVCSVIRMQCGMP